MPKVNCITAIGAEFVEPASTIAQGLPVPAANTRRFLPAPALDNCRQQQQPAALIAILRCLCNLPKVSSGVISAKPNRRRHEANLLRTSARTHAARLKTQMSQMEEPLVSVQRILSYGAMPHSWRSVHWALDVEKPGGDLAGDEDQMGFYEKSKLMPDSVMMVSFHASTCVRH